PPSAVATFSGESGRRESPSVAATDGRRSTSRRRTRPPPAANDSANAPATVDLPVPPFPVTTCTAVEESSTASTVDGGRGYRVSMSTTWEYATVPLLTHATKQILDTWGEDRWELVTVLPGPTGEQHVAYLKRPKED